MYGVIRFRNRFLVNDHEDADANLGDTAFLPHCHFLGVLAAKFHLMALSTTMMLTMTAKMTSVDKTIALTV